MKTEMVNILALVLGFIAIIEPFILSYLTNKLIQKEDERAKRMIEATQRLIDESKKDTQRLIDESKRETQKLIDEGNKRIERIIDEGNKRLEIILSEVLKRV